MAADLAREWAANSSEALDVQLKHPSDSSKDVQFNPTFTYSIFGDEEVIYGYKDLRVILLFKGDTLDPGLDVRFGDKIDRVGDVKLDSVEEKLKDFLPTLLGDQRPPPEAATTKEHFQPPGKLIHRYEAGGRQFGIWAASLTDPSAKRILRNMQIFVPFFIEGGTFIELDDPEWTMERWTIYFLYTIDPHPTNTDKSTHSLAGYGTAYRLFFLDADSEGSYLLTPPSSQNGDQMDGNVPPSDAPLPPAQSKLSSQLPSRSRISQFVILPPYQRSGHGSHLYTTMLTHAVSDDTVREVTVEDPNEDFDDLRDLNDLIYLRANYPAFRNLSINIKLDIPAGGTRRAQTRLPRNQLLDQDALQTLQAKTRLCQRQFDRLVEMQTLSAIPPLHRSSSRITRKDKASDLNDRAYYWWRMLVKQRLTKHNADKLAQLDLEERVEKLDDTVETVAAGFLKTLDRAEGRVAVEVGLGKDAGMANGTNGVKGRKRPATDDEDEDVVATGTPRRKKARILDESE